MNINSTRTLMVLIGLMLTTNVLAVDPWLVYKKEYKRIIDGTIRYCNCYSVSKGLLMDGHYPVEHRSTFASAAAKRDSLASRDPDTCPGRCSGGSVPPEPTTVNSWDHIADFGTVTLDGSKSGSGSGTFTQSGGGILKGTWHGSTFLGIWITHRPSKNQCSEERQGSKSWGKVKFEFWSTKVTGWWDYCGGGSHYRIDTNY